MGIQYFGGYKISCDTGRDVTYTAFHCVLMGMGSHMNADVAEVNGFDPRMLPDSFLYEKEPGYEARYEANCRGSQLHHSRLLRSAYALYSLGEF